MRGAHLAVGGQEAHSAALGSRGLQRCQMLCSCLQHFLPPHTLQEAPPGPTPLPCPLSSLAKPHSGGRVLLLGAHSSPHGWAGRGKWVGGAFCTFYCFFFSWKTKQNPNASIPHFASILHSAFSIIAPSPLAGQCHQTPGYSSPQPWGRCPGPPTLMRIQIGSRGLEQLREQGVCRQQMVLDGPQGEVSGMGHSPGQSRGNEAEERRSGFPAIVPMGCCRDGHDALHCEVLGMQCSHGSAFHPSGAHCPMAVHGANGEQSPAGVQGLWNEGP